MKINPTLEGINEILRQTGATPLAKFAPIHDLLFIANIENGPHVLVGIDSTLADQWIAKGRSAEDVFVIHLFATLHAAIDLSSGVNDVITGSPFIGRKYLPPNASYPSINPEDRFDYG